MTIYDEAHSWIDARAQGRERWEYEDLRAAYIAGAERQRVLKVACDEIEAMKPQKSRKAKTHAIERTSPKGGPFIGTCWQCGKTGLKASAALEPCENIAALTEDESLVLAVTEGEKP